MRLRVEHELVQVDLVAVVAEQQIEVFERLAKPERFHHVFWSCVQRAFDVADRRVTVRHSRVRFEGLENRPAHVLIRFVASD